jgi:hypothetical protein
MSSKTLALWEKQDQHKGDRWRLFKAMSDFIPAKKVLYPGSYVDLAPSFVFDDVTYTDMDKRAAKFFEDDTGVKQIIESHEGNPNARVKFIPGDYNALALKAESFDLLISLYAGFISEPCGHLLRIGGMLLVNSSHGDAALAALDARFELMGVIHCVNGEYKVDDQNLDRFMVPKKPKVMTRESILSWGRGIAYTKSPFAYLFRRIS